MSRQHLPPQAPQAHAGASSDEQSAAATRLRGRWLVVARSAWVILFVLNLVRFAMALVSQISAVEHPGVDLLYTIKPAQAESLRRLGCCGKSLTSSSTSVCFSFSPTVASYHAGRGSCWSVGPRTTGRAS